MPQRRIPKCLLIAATLMLQGRMVLAQSGGRDVLETRKGEHFTGTVTLEAEDVSGLPLATSSSTKPTEVTVDTSYGTISVAAARIFRINGLGETYLRQLLVTQEGEAFSGRLGAQTARLVLPNGQVMHVPLPQVKSIEFHPDSAPAVAGARKFHPLAVLRSGDSLFIRPPTVPIPAVTRYGAIDLPAASISEIVLHKADGANDPDMYVFTLIDGSTFGGFIGGSLPFHLAGAAGERDVTIPIGNLTRVQFAEKAAKPASTVPATAPANVAGQLKLPNEDMLMGTLTGPLVLDTAFDPVNLDGSEIATLTRSEETHAISVTLWDATAVTGELTQPAVEFSLALGGTLHVPVTYLRGYTQPAPRIPQRVKQQVKALVAKLSGPDADSARTALAAMGSRINPLLDEIRATAPKETQDKVDAFRGVKKD